MKQRVNELIVIFYTWYTTWILILICWQFDWMTIYIPTSPLLQAPPSEESSEQQIDIRVCHTITPYGSTDIVVVLYNYLGLWFIWMYFILNTLYFGMMVWSVLHSVLGGPSSIINYSLDGLRHPWSNSSGWTSNFKKEGSSLLGLIFKCE
jgi:hypothetical protein